MKNGEIGKKSKIDELEEDRGIEERKGIVELRKIEKIMIIKWSERIVMMEIEREVIKEIRIENDERIGILDRWEKKEIRVGRSWRNKGIEEGKMGK